MFSPDPGRERQTPEQPRICRGDQENRGQSPKNVCPSRWRRGRALRSASSKARTCSGRSARSRSNTNLPSSSLSNRSIEPIPSSPEFPTIETDSPFCRAGRGASTVGARSLQQPGLARRCANLRLQSARIEGHYLTQLLTFRIILDLDSHPGRFRGDETGCAGESRLCGDDQP